MAPVAQTAGTSGRTCSQGMSDTSGTGTYPEPRPPFPSNVTLSHTFPLQDPSLLSAVSCSADTVVTNGRSVYFPCPQGLLLRPWVFLGTLFPSPIPTSFPKHMKPLHVPGHPGTGHVCSPSQASQPERGRHSHRSQGCVKGASLHLYSKTSVVDTFAPGQDKITGSRFTFPPATK